MITPKNIRIKESIKTTRERRNNMLCRTYEVKIIRGKLSKCKKDFLDALFREAKWLRNSELSKGDLSLMDRDAKTAVVKVGDRFETRDLEHLGSQIKQDIVDQIKTDAHGLAVLKEHGYKAGALKFKSYCNSIPLRQFGKTFRIDFSKNQISIQKCRKPFKVRGLKQIPEDAEIANARLVRKSSGYYFHITTYQKPTVSKSTDKRCGIDFGIKNNLTLSTGEIYDLSVLETHAVKTASRAVNKSLSRNGGQKGKNHRKRMARLRRAYERQTNKKRDKANKITHEILENYDFVAMQDEMIANWHKGLFGKQVQHSAMGYIKANLRRSSKVHAVSRCFPSTQKCPVCGKNTKHPLSKRDYDCVHCGFHHPSRDIKAAEMILDEAIRNASNDNVSTEHRAKSPVEVTLPDDCTDSQKTVRIAIKVPPMKQEAQVL